MTSLAESDRRFSEEHDLSSRRLFVEDLICQIRAVSAGESSPSRLPSPRSGEVRRSSERSRVTLIWRRVLIKKTNNLIRIIWPNRAADVPSWLLENFNEKADLSV